MRLLGVVKVTSILSSRLGISGTGGSIVEEFSAQMRAVSKISLTRKSNFSVFLEMNGICFSVTIYCLSICMVQTQFCFVYPLYKVIGATFILKLSSPFRFV